MTALLAMATFAMAQAVTLPGVVAPPTGAGPRVWIGYGDRLNFAFGDALTRALAQGAPGLGGDRPAARRIVAPQTADGSFAYAIDLLRPAANGRERVTMTDRGRCTAATLDTCAADVAARMARRGN